MLLKINLKVFQVDKDLMETFHIGHWKKQFWNNIIEIFIWNINIYGVSELWTNSENCWEESHFPDNIQTNYKLLVKV